MNKPKITKDRFYKLLDIYEAADRLITELGAEGQIDTNNSYVNDLMNALYEYDQGFSDK